MSAHEDDRDARVRIQKPRLPRLPREDVPDALVEKASDALSLLRHGIPGEYSDHTRNEVRHALAAVLPEIQAQAFESGARSYAASDPCCGTYHLHEFENPHTGEAIPTREGEDDL